MKRPDMSYDLFHVKGKRSRADPINVNGANIAMEIDTGAHHSLISESTYHGTWSHGKLLLEPVTIPLQTYTGEKLTVLGSINVSVKYTYKDQQQELSLLVIAGSGPSIIGRDWMKRIQFDWKSFGLFKVHATQSSLDDVLNRHPDIFKDELGFDSAKWNKS